MYNREMIIAGSPELAETNDVPLSTGPTRPGTLTVQFQARLRPLLSHVQFCLWHTKEVR